MNTPKTHPRAGMAPLATLAPLAAIALVASLAAAACDPAANAGLTPPEDTPAASPAASPAAGPDHLPALRLPTAPVRTAAPRELVLHGSVVSLDERVLAFEQGGTLREVLVERGDHVSAGDVLARLEDDALRIAQRSQRARADELEARRTQIASDLERTRQLAAQGAATERQVEELEAALASTEAGLRGVAAERDELDRRRRELVLRAPVAAEVMDVPMRTGSVVDAGTPVVLLRGGAAREAEVAVPESWVAIVEAGMPAEVHFPVAGMPAVEGEVEALLEPLPGRSLSRARLRLPEGVGVRTGMRVEVVVRVAEEGLEVPVAALARTPSPAVWRVREGRAEAVPVEVGRLRGTHAEVTGALAEGDVVLTAGLDRMMDGRAVAPVETANAEGADAEGANAEGAR